jgi:hypothetical protein
VITPVDGTAADYRMRTLESIQMLHDAAQHLDDGGEYMQKLAFLSIQVGALLSISLAIEEVGDTLEDIWRLPR